MSEEDIKIRACWLSGSFFHCKFILSQLKEKIGIEKVYIYDENDSAEKIEMEINGNDLFNERKIILLKGIPHFKGTVDKSNKKWIELIKGITDDYFLIVHSDDTSSRLSIYNYIKKNGKVFDPPSHLKKKEALAYFSERIEELNKVIDPDMVKYVIDGMGNTAKGVPVDKIIVFIKAMMAYVGRKKNIEKEDVMRCFSMNKDFVIWDILNAIDDRDIVKCQELVYLNCLNSSSVKSALEGILATSLWRFRLLLMIKDCKSNNLSDKELLVKVKEFSKTSREGSGYSTTYKADSEEDKLKPVYSDFVINNLINGFYGQEATINKYSITELLGCVKVLEECIIKTRVSLTETEALLSFDSFLYYICRCKDMDYEILEDLRSVKYE